MQLVRVGAVGHVGRFRPVDHRRRARGTRVVVRTARGLETGAVLGEADPEAPADGVLLRQMSTADELLDARLQRSRAAALDACEQQLRERQLDAVLLDAELLFDGQSLYFYFLGEPTDALNAVTAELAKTYDATAQVRQFAEALELGCGPDCGTDSAAGCGSDSGCATCAVAAACKTTGADSGASHDDAS